MKYILVTGGVISGIGKGVVASSLGVILKHCGIPVTSIKIDPYINIGTFIMLFCRTTSRRNLTAYRYLLCTVGWSDFYLRIYILLTKKWIVVGNLRLK